MNDTFIKPKPGFVGSLIEAGKQLGVFEALAEQGRLSGEQLAQATDCSYEPLIDLLSLMVHHDLLEHEPETQMLSLPVEPDIFGLSTDASFLGKQGLRIAS